MSCWLRENAQLESVVLFDLLFAERPECAPGPPPLHGYSECEGRTDPVHLIPQQLLRRELGSRKAGYEMLVVAGCRKHHHLLDQARKLKIPRERLPESVEAFAAAHNLGWYLDREYGAPQEKEDQAA